MYDDIKDVKSEFVTRNNEIFCQACLSGDRKLYSLAELKEVYQRICNIEPVENTVLCWECRMVLKKAVIFKSRVETAQLLLKQYFKDNQILLQSCLSNLKLVNNNNNNIIEIDHDAEHLKYQNLHIDTKVKDEVDYDNYDYYHSDVDLDIKDEFNDTVIKKEDENNKIVCSNKRSNYKVINNGIVAKCKIIPINPKELSMWIENERCNEFYKNFKYKCVHCLCGWSFKKSYLEHNKRYHNMGHSGYICDICTSRFASKMKLSYHMSRHYTARQCCSCGYRCYNATNMTHHLRMHLRCVQCSYCGASFSNCRQFFAHYKAIHTEFLCDHCGRRFKSKHRLEKHMTLHADVHECPDCNKRYKTLAALRSHRDFHHTVSRTELSYCAPCDRQFNNVAIYRRHLTTSVAHAKERAVKQKKIFPCPECANVYTRNTYMRNHYTLVHMKQSKHYCVDCDKQFLNRTRFLDHRQRKHEGIIREKNKLCNICGRGFATNRILLNHIRTHTGERPFECEYCTAKFTQKQAMLSHVKYIHLKSKRRSGWHE